MTRNLQILLFAIFVFMTMQLTGQDTKYIFRQINFEKGLPGQNARQVYQDKNGIIWISVEALGLCRYDGRNFNLYSHNYDDSTSITSNYIIDIIEDKNQDLWVATEKGLNKYDRATNSFKRYLSSPERENWIASNIIECLFVDSENNFWIGTSKGLYKYNYNSDDFKKIDIKSEGDELWINVIYEHSYGDFFLGTRNGVIKYNKATGEVEQWNNQISPGNCPTHPFIRTISEDSKGNLWIGTHRGLCKFILNKEKFERFVFNEKDAAEFANEGFNKSYTKDFRNIWFASYTSGIVIVNTEKNIYQRLSKESNTEGTLKSNHIRHIYRDKTGLLWVSTKFGGLFIYNENKDLFSELPYKYSIFQKIRNMHILSFYNDYKEDLVWVGTKHNGLFKVNIKKQKIENYRYDIKNKNTIADNRIHSIFRDSDGDLWVGLGNGLDFFDEKNNRFIHYGQSITDFIIESHDNTVWAGTFKGLYVINKKEQRLERFKGNPDTFFSSTQHLMYSYIDSRGQIWFATRYNGLYRYNVTSNELIHFSSNNKTNKIRGDAIRVITEDLHKNIWIGTKSDGICIYNPRNDSINYITSANGLASDFVLCIQRDYDGNIWLGGHNGLSKYDFKNKRFTNFTTAHGLQSNIFELGANGIWEDGYLLFGGHNGLNIFHPDAISKKYIDEKDSVIITSIKAFNDEMVRDLHKDTTIEFSYRQNYISVEFVLSDFAEPMNHKFKYRLVEAGKEWIELGNKNFVAFSNLNPATYHLQINGVNEFGEECEHPLNLTFVIKPVFYQTWWFKTLIALLLLSLSAVIIWMKINQAKKTKKYLENEIMIRTEEIREVNIELQAQNNMIAEQKTQIEKNKELLEIKVKERTQELEKAKLRAEESDKLKSSFLANMSHEIRTPLNAILGFSNLIADQVQDDEKLSRFGQHITNSSEMLLKIINDIIDISKIEAGQLDVVKSKINIDELFKFIYNNFSQQIREKYQDNVEFIIKYPAEEGQEIFIYSDLVRLKQIIFNLMSNAVKFTKKGHIKLGCMLENGFVRFYVEDTGIGINEKYQPAIFKRFVKVEDKNSLYRGNGLGLSLCKNITRILGGKIWVESKEGEGSIFYFTIPVKKPNED